MKMPIPTPKSQVALLVAAALCFAAPMLHAQTGNVATVTGTATSTGRIKRSIIDITKPGGGVRGQYFRPAGVAATTDIYVPVTPGQTADQIGWNLCLQARTQLQPLGYTVTFYRPSPDYQDVEFIRPVGSFSVVDSVEVSGITLTNRFVQLNNGSATSPWLSALAAGLLGLIGYRIQRRKRAI